MRHTKPRPSRYLRFVALALTAIAGCGVTPATPAEPPAATRTVTVGVPTSMRSAPFDQPRTLNVPEGFKIDVLARIPDARFMAVAPNGDVFVSVPKAGTVKVIRPRAGHDPEVFDYATGLSQPHDLVFHTIGSVMYLYVAEQDRVARYTYTPGDRTGRGRQEIITGLPTQGSDNLTTVYRHTLKNIVIDAQHTLYVSIASASNADPVDLDANPKRGAIYAYTADGKNPRLYAEGIRNAVGLAFAPGTNDLWAVVNGRDNIRYPHHRDADGDGTDDYGKSIPAYVYTHPPDTVLRVRDGKHYGWPFCNPTPDGPGGLRNMPYDADVETNPGASRFACSNAARAEGGFHAHSAPLGLTFWTHGPGPYRNVMTVGLHGCGACSPTIATEVVMLTLRPDGTLGEERDLVTGWVTDPHNLNTGRWGRPVDTADMPDGSLLISDDKSGTVYRLYR